MPQNVRIRSLRERPFWVSGGKYSAKLLGGGFRAHTGPPLFILANFGTRTEPVTQDRSSLSLRPQTYAQENSDQEYENIKQINDRLPGRIP